MLSAGDPFDTDGWARSLVSVALLAFGYKILMLAHSPEAD